MAPSLWHALRRQDVLPPVERLANLREALAIVTIRLARSHGGLGFVPSCPPPSAQWAEDAVRLLHDTLAQIAAPPSAVAPVRSHYAAVRS